MKIKKIKQGHITNCIYCKAEGRKELAVWHLTVKCLQSCDKHREILEDFRKVIYNIERDHYTEADYQTWMRL